MKKHLLIIALFALIACITMPVQAGLLGTYTTGTAAWANAVAFNNGMWVRSTDEFVNYDVYQVIVTVPMSYYPSKDNSISWSGNCTLGSITMNCGVSADYTSMTTDDYNPVTQITTFTFSNISKNGQANTSATIAYSSQWWNGKGYYCGGTAPGGPHGYEVPTTASDMHEVIWFDGANHEACRAQSVEVYGSDPVAAPVTSFTCTPTSQYPDTSVVCTDSSTNTPTDWYWTIDAEAMGIDAWQTHTGQNFTWESHYPGLYSVNLRANNSAGSDWENKSNYVSISVNATPNNCNLPIANGYIRTYAQTNDGMTSGGIYNSDIQMRDMEGGAWSNVTTSGGWWCIDTLPGHSLNLYAQATGYTSAEMLGVSANGGRHYLVMWPDYIPDPSAGNVSLYVLVYDQQTGSPLYLSTVRVDGNNINTFMKNTGPEGQAVFTIKNDTSIHVTASKDGYDTITKVMTTSHLGPDTLMISLPRSIVNPTATQTIGPGGTIPTTIGPYGTPGPSGTMPAGYTNNQGQIMMDFLARNGMSLVELCFFVTILELLGVKLGK